MTATANKIRQSELMARHKMKPGEITAFRTANLSRDIHWWKEGTVIYWTEEAARFLELRGKETEQKPEASDLINIRIVKPCNNPRFVIGDLNGFKVYVVCPRTVSKNLIGKTVKVRVTKNGDETTYQYEP